MSATVKPRSATPRAPMPAPPVRQYSFTSWQTANPTAPPPGDRLDAEYDRANTAVSQTITWASTSLNTDGTIRDGIIDQSNLVSGLFDDIAVGIIDDVQPMVDDAQGFANAAQASSLTAQAAATSASTSNTAAQAASTSASASASTATAQASAANSSALAAQNAAATATNAASNAAGDEAAASDYAVVTQAWAEHMPDTIPPNILAVMGVTGDHWSSRWWANQAAVLTTTFGAQLAYVQDTPPLNPPDKSLWWDSSGTGLYIRYNDGSSTQWVVAENQNTLTDAPIDANVYARSNQAWIAISYMPLSGGTASGPIAAAFLRTNGATGPTWTAGTGAPSGTQPLGSLYSRTDGAVGTTFYVSRGGGVWAATAGV